MNPLQLEAIPEIDNYFDVMTNQNFTSSINLLTRIASKSKSLLDNIFFNEFSSDVVSGNATVGLSVHILHFALIFNKAFKSSASNATSQNTFIRTYKKMNIGAFDKDLYRIDWEGVKDLNVHQYEMTFSIYLTNF